MRIRNLDEFASPNIKKLFNPETDLIPDADFDYEPPIKLIQQQMEMKLEGDILNAVYRYGIDVNKEELLKALAYDREQYRKGFNDAKKKYAKPKANWIMQAFNDDRGHFKIAFMCDNCKIHTDYATDFCPHCGADTRKENTENDSV